MGPLSGVCTISASVECFIEDHVGMESISVPKFKNEFRMGVVDTMDERFLPSKIGMSISCVPVPRHRVRTLWS